MQRKTCTYECAQNESYGFCARTMCFGSLPADGANWKTPRGSSAESSFQSSARSQVLIRKRIKEAKELTIGRLAWIIGAAILALAINVAVSFLYIGIYSYLINPGHDKDYYQNYATQAAPYSSIVVGMPLMFLICWRVGSWWEADFAVNAALLVWLVYAVIDVLVLVAAGISSGMPARLIVLAAISLITKLAASYFGGIVGRSQV